MGYSDLLDKADFAIIQSMADCNMCISDVARKNYRSPNSIQYHLRKVKRISGKDPKNFYDLMWMISRMSCGRPINEEEWYA